MHDYRCNNVGTMRWENFETTGCPPSPRYGHSMLTLQHRQHRQDEFWGGRMVVFGGTSGQQAFNDMYMATLSSSLGRQGPSLRLNWDSVMLRGVPPCPRSRQTMCEIGGELIIFGGSDENVGRGSHEEPKSKEVDTHVCHVRPCFTVDGEGEETGEHFRPWWETATRFRPHREQKEDTQKFLSWECIQPESYVYEPGPEPPVMVDSQTLHTDMQTLVGSSLSSDILFKFQAVDFNVPTTPSNTAHYALVSPPGPSTPPTHLPADLARQNCLYHHHSPAAGNVNTTAIPTGSSDVTSSTHVQPLPHARDQRCPGEGERE
ncbi:unnamed protein product, partial [Discosporangium mesarthrocarpum]